MKKEIVCKINCVNKGAVQKVKEKMLQDNIILNIVNIFKLLGDPTRTKILYALTNGELCVCDLAASLKMSQSAVSHQLRVLRDSNLVKFRKDGKIVYYSLADDHVVKLIKMGVEHANE